MLLRSLRTGGFVVGVLCLSALSMAQTAADVSSPIHGVIEQFFEAGPHERGVTEGLTYGEAHIDIGKNWRVVGSMAQDRDYWWLEDTFVEYDNGPTVIKAGRMRADFGYGSWSDLYYTPFIGLPLIRSYAVEVVPGFSLYAQERGIEYETSSGNWQIQLSGVDSSDDDWSITPSHLDTAMARLQYCAGHLIFGVNGFAKAGDHDGPAEQIGGIDFTYTVPRLQLRGEAIAGNGAEGAKGYYLDAFYRPPGLARTELGLRVQGVAVPVLDSEYLADSYDSADSAPPELRSKKFHVYTLAARQFVTPNLTLSVNYGFGTDSPLTRGLLGWSSQLLFTYRF